MQQDANITFEVTGSVWNREDPQESFPWVLANTTPADWLHVINSSGFVVAGTSTDRDQTNVAIPIRVSAAGIWAGQHEASIKTIVTLPARDDTARLAPQLVGMQVQLVVTAVPILEKCSIDAGQPLPHLSRLGWTSVLTFTARDVEGMPCKLVSPRGLKPHTTVATTSTRIQVCSACPCSQGRFCVGNNFSASICLGDCTSANEKLLPIKYISDGQYAVQIVLLKLGSYSVSVFLDGSPISNFQNVPVRAICPPHEFASGNECHQCSARSTVCGQRGARAESEVEVTVANLDVLPGYWRLSNLTEKIYPCSTMNDRTPCIGGVGVNYCSNATGGPLCASCLQPQNGMRRRHGDQHANCLECKRTQMGAVAVLLFVLLGGAVFICALLRAAFRIPALRKLLLCVLKTWRELGITSKLKLLFAYFQVMTLMPEICK